MSSRTAGKGKYSLLLINANILKRNTDELERLASREAVGRDVFPANDRVTVLSTVIFSRQTGYVMKELLLKPAILAGSPPNGDASNQESTLLWVASGDR